MKKNRFSCMIHPDAVCGLPANVREKVLARMRKVPDGSDPDIDWIGASERKRISRIHEEAFDGWISEEK